MDKLSGLMAFVKAADLGSFVGAARALEMSASAVGKAVTRLEHELGVRLLERTTRRVQLTDEGRHFHERCQRILEDLDDAQTMLSRTQEVPRGRLRVSAPIVSHHFLVPLIPGFLDRYPDIELDMSFNDRSLDLIEHGIHVAIRSGDLPDSNLISRPLQSFRLLLCASPTYLNTHGTPRTPSELTGHAAIRFRHPNSGKLLEWPLNGTDTQDLSGLRTVLACNNIEAVLGATLRHVGIACMPDFLVRTALAQTQLVSVLDEYLNGDGRYSLLWPSGRHQSPKVRAFIDYLGQQLVD
jgi:DNA-binding transcriptional LysR family regulator